MKHRVGKPLCLLILAMGLLLLPSLSLAEPEISRENWETTGPSGSFVRWPVLTTENPERAEIIAAVNESILENARVQEYLALLPAISEGSTGIRMDYEMALSDRYASILFSVQGKMLAGRPGQAYYPMTFDLVTGEQVPFDALFSDPDGGKAFIEEALENEVEPLLSTYLENRQLFPAPYDRFFLDGRGNLVFCYDANQLSFLSGFSGAVAFRYSELWPYLDTAVDGIAMSVMDAESADQYAPTRSADFDLATLFQEEAKLGRLPGLFPAPFLGQPLDTALEAYRAAADSEFYPGGAYYEVEEPRLRGTLLLTDDSETAITGILTSRVDAFGIETGKTTLDEAEALLGLTNGVRIPIDEAAAELYRVCPGTALICDFSGAQLTLYADESGVVRAVRLTAGS